MAQNALNSLKNFTINGRKILGAGKNYHALIKLQNDTVPKKPVIFLKPSTSYVTEDNPIILPKEFKVNQETELGVIIGKRGKNIKKSEALNYVGGYCLALDMTATSVLTEARKNGLPWEIGKGFDTACPVSMFIPKEKIPNPDDVNFWCKVNDKITQKANTSDMIFSISDLISYCSLYMTLEPNDLILTGSPPGMGPVYQGDTIEAGIENVITIKFKVQCTENI